MPLFCVKCGSQLSERASFCANCGTAVVPAPAGGSTVPVGPSQTLSRPAAANPGLSDNVAGLIAYITIIPAIIFLVLEPYNRRPFVRFHALQSLFFGISWIVISAVMNAILFRVPFFGFAIASLVNLALLIAWIVCLIKAYGGERWKLPVIGDLAEQQANKP